MMSAANPKIVVGSLNLQGVKNSKKSTRLAQMLAAANRAKIDVLLAQEHNITEELSADAQILAKRAGFCMALGFCPQGVARGGTAVLIRRTTFGLPDTHTLTHTQHMHGRIVVATVPAHLMLGAEANAKPLTFASVYVPAQAHARLQFLKEIAAGPPPISRSTIVGTDANCVPDVALDVLYPAGVKTKYKNQHAQKFELWMARLGLEDVFRVFHGKTARGYSRQGKSVFTRIDRLYAPHDIPDFHWSAHEFSDAVTGRRWASDHLAVLATLTRTNGVEKGKGRPRIDPEIYLDPAARACVWDAINHVATNYPTSEYGDAVVWEHLKHVCRGVCRRLSADRKPKRTEVALREAHLDTHVQAANASPTPAYHKKLTKLRKSLSSSLDKYRAASGEQALRRTEADEVSSKRFHARFRQRGERRPIPELLPMGPDGLPDCSASPVHSPQELLREATTYYSTLMDERPIDKEAAEEIYKLFEARPLDPKRAAAVNNVVTEDKVLAAIAKMAKGKSPGPDALPAEFYKAFGGALAPILTRVLYKSTNLLLG